MTVVAVVDNDGDNKQGINNNGGALTRKKNTKNNNKQTCLLDLLLTGCCKIENEQFFFATQSWGFKLVNINDAEEALSGKYARLVVV